MDVISKCEIKAISHITGGGFIENIPRMLSDGLCAVINKGTWDILPIFDLLQRAGNLPEKEMYNTFNMGIGMVLAVDKNEADKVIEILESHGEKASIIGRVEKGENEVVFE